MCVLGNILWIEQYLRRGLLYPFNYGSIFYIKCIPADFRRVSAETPEGESIGLPKIAA